MLAPRVVLVTDFTVPESPQSEGDGKNPAPLPHHLHCCADSYCQPVAFPAVLLRFAIRRANNKTPSTETIVRQTKLRSPIESLPRLLQIQVFVRNRRAQRIVPEPFIGQGYPPHSTTAPRFWQERLQDRRHHETNKADAEDSECWRPAPTRDGRSQQTSEGSS